MLFVKSCIKKQFQMATYTKYVISIATNICQHASFVVPGFQNSVILLTNINITKTNCFPCYSDCTQYTHLPTQNYKQWILLASDPTSYTCHKSPARPLHTHTHTHTQNYIYICIYICAVQQDTQSVLMSEFIHHVC